MAFKTERIDPQRARARKLLSGTSRLVRTMKLTGTEAFDHLSIKSYLWLAGLGTALLPAPAAAFTSQPAIELHGTESPTYRLFGYGSFAAGAGVMKLAARREGINERHAVTAFLLGTGMGVLGALGLHHLETGGVLLNDLLSNMGWANPHSTGWGFSWFGGLGAGIATMLYYARVKMLPLGKFLDALAPAGLITHSVARLGCLIGGDDCWGKVTDSVLGMDLNGVARHPAPLYLAAADLVSAAVVWRMFKGKKFTGQLFLTALALHSLTRFAVEFVRDNPPLLGTPLTEYQYISLGLFSLSTSLLAYLGLRKARPAKPQLADKPDITYEEARQHFRWTVPDKVRTFVKRPLLITIALAANGLGGFVTAPLAGLLISYLYEKARHPKTEDKAEAEKILANLMTTVKTLDAATLAGVILKSTGKGEKVLAKEVLSRLQTEDAAKYDAVAAILETSYKGRRLLGIPFKLMPPALKTLASPLLRYGGMLAIPLADTLLKSDLILSNQQPDYQVAPAAVLATLAGSALAGTQLAARRPLMQTGLGLMAAGLIGNLIDLMQHPFVVNFMEVAHRAFNLSDVSLAVGSFLLAVGLFRDK